MYWCPTIKSEELIYIIEICFKKAFLKGIFADK